jgi:hypothetical protein
MMKFEHIPAERRDVRKFGYLFAGAGAVIGAYMLWKGSGAWVWALSGGAAFLLAGLFAYPLLRPVYISWMKFAFVLGWVNTRVILSLFFYIVLTPAGLLMRLLGRDPMQRKFDPSAGSYWVKREQQPFNPDRYENLF